MKETLKGIQQYFYVCPNVQKVYKYYFYDNK